MEFKDYYRIMGVERDATQDEIKRAYRQLARKYHPDVSTAADAEARFKELGEANAVLKDLEKRAAYDALGMDWKAGQDFSPPPDWNTGFEFSGDGGGGPGGRDFSDFFEALHGSVPGAGSRGRQGFNARGEDHHAKIAIDLEDAYTGATRTITLQTPKMDAQGRIAMAAHTLQVTIPVGIRGGQHIRLVGQGVPGIGRGPPGDLFLEITFHPHARYRVDQRDVYIDLPVAPWEVALGATVKVPTPGGIVALKIPAGSTAGTRLRLKGRGLPGSTPGDCYALLHLAMPPAADTDAEAFYRTMATQFAAFDPRAGLGV